MRHEPSGFRVTTAVAAWPAVKCRVQPQVDELRAQPREPAVGQALPHLRDDRLELELHAVVWRNVGRADRGGGWGGAQHGSVMGLKRPLKRRVVGGSRRDPEILLDSKPCGLDWLMLP